jgi:hypothetical protein
MAEQTFKSPGFFEREIEIISRPLFRSNATPAGLIGTSERGPAFVPTTVSSREEFIRIFGAPHRSRIATHAMAEFFRNNGKALTFCRTLGTGNAAGGAAGFKLKSTVATEATRSKGAVHFIAAQHTVSNAEFIGLGSFNDNDSHSTDIDNDLNLNDAADGDATLEIVRAMIFAHKDYIVKIYNSTSEEPTASDTNDIAVAAISEFKILFDNETTKTEPLLVSLDPSSDKYISKVLNTDPFAFESEKHLLYAHFPVDKAVADVANGKVAVLHGKVDGDTQYNNFSSKFTTPKTPAFISQPFGQKEYDLFHFETLHDGAYANDKYKISISNLRASTDPTNDFGTFTVTIRDLKDTDNSPIVYETFSQCSLDPNAENFIGRVVGDQKVFYDYAASSKDERRLVREGSFPNKSTIVRVIVNDDVLKSEVPSLAMPFGFRGVPALLLNDAGVDQGKAGGSTVYTKGKDLSDNLDRAVLPPLPYRFKVTNGSIKTGDSYNQTFLGQASSSESINFNLHWGLMTSRVSDINDANKGTEFNEVVLNYTKFLGADTTVIKSGSLADSHNNNKFSLAKVALKGAALSDVSGTVNDVFKDAAYVRNADVGNSATYDASQHLVKMSGTNDPFSGEGATDVASDSLVVGVQYKIKTVGTGNFVVVGASSSEVGVIFTATGTSTGQNDGLAIPYNNRRVSLAKVLAEDPVKFNKYSTMAKFTAPIHGGFDGVNILDRDSYYMTDRSASTETGGKAGDGGFTSGLSGTSDAAGFMQGTEDNNNIVASFKNAIRIMTDDMVVNHNILVIPNIRDSFVTDFAKRKAEGYGKAIYLMDIPQYTADSVRIFVDSRGIESGRPDVDTTSSLFDMREVNSSYSAVYFPDVKVLDSGDDDEAAVNSRRTIKVPPSIIAFGALAKTDDETQPWFAPAGFSRGALNTISSIDVRLNAEDRDTLYEARINPIANFPNKQFVIFGQKTTQLARTALDRVNVRRLVLEVKRRIELIAQGLLFEQNNSRTRSSFVESSTAQLASIQINQGIEDFRVVMDDSNNTAEDVDNNRLNGKIIIVPTRAVEFIAIDFVITNSGVEFP